MSPFLIAATSSALVSNVSTTAVLPAVFFDWTVVRAMDASRAMMWSTDGSCWSLAVTAASTDGMSLQAQRRRWRTSSTPTTRPRATHRSHRRWSGIGGQARVDGLLFNRVASGVPNSLGKGRHHDSVRTPAPGHRTRFVGYLVRGRSPAAAL